MVVAAQVNPPGWGSGLSEADVLYSPSFTATTYCRDVDSIPEELVPLSFTFDSRSRSL
jgi:hypothetical protein